MTIEAYTYTYPWNVLDPGADTVLGLVRNELGATGLSVVLTSPPVTRCSMRNEAMHLHRSRGGFYFTPQDDRYENTRCKPIVSSWVKGKSVLDRIAGACAALKLKLRCTLSASRTARLAQRYPEMATKNVTGEPSHHSLCLINPDVQAFLTAVIDDVTHCEQVDSIVLTDFLPVWWEAYAEEVTRPVIQNQTYQSLLGLCVCESCRQAAGQHGVETESAINSVQSMLVNAVDRGRPIGANLDTILSDNEPLTAWLEWRGQALSKLWASLSESCRCDLVLDQRDDPAYQDGWRGFDLSHPRAVLTHLPHSESLESIRNPVLQRQELRIPASMAMGDQGSKLVQTVKRAVELGFSGVEFEDGGLLGTSGYTSVKQAIRFARR